MGFSSLVACHMSLLFWLSHRLFVYLSRHFYEWAWSSSYPLIFLQNTRCSTHTYHSRRQKFCSRRTACVEQFTDYYKTDHQLRTVQATSENTFIRGLETAAHCDSWLLCAMQIHLLTYLHSYSRLYDRLHSVNWPLMSVECWLARDTWRRRVWEPAAYTDRLGRVSSGQLSSVHVLWTPTLGQLGTRHRLRHDATNTTQRGRQTAHDKAVTSLAETVSACFHVVGPDLFFSRRRSEGRPHHWRTFSIPLRPKRLVTLLNL